MDGNYRSHWNSNASPSIYTEVKGYALTNLRAGFRGEGFDVFGWVRNVFDVNYIENLQVAPGNAASLRAVLGSGGWTPVGAELLYPPAREEPAP